VRTAVLHLDDALTPQARLREAVCAGGGREIDCRDLGPELRLWTRPSSLQRLRDRLAQALPAGEGPMLVFAGSGDFHHITPTLVARALASAGEREITVVHFDNHPDWVTFEPGAHCGSWVGHVARLPGVAKVVTVGVCSRDIERPEAEGADLQLVRDGKVELYAYGAESGVAQEIYAAAGRAWPTISGLGEEAFAAYLRERVTTDAVYVTIDKDVLRPEDAGTNWDQGRTSPDLLAALVRAAADGREVVGADVVGDWSAPAYGGGLVNALLKRGEAVLDQPWRPPPPEVRVRNEDVNLMLLELFEGVGA